MKAILTLAHGAGAGMNHRFMTALAGELANLGIGSIRFNFPYMENGKKRPDVSAVAEKTISVMLAHTHENFPKTPLFASGKSFGGRMSSQCLSKECPDYIKGISFFGFPLHPPGNPSTDRAEHLKSIKIPMLFLQGTRDTLAEMKLVEKVCKMLSTSTLIKFEGADHSFKSGKREFIPELAQAVNNWIHS
ncbi:MAG: dienelactone hydrolase family protein [Flammeovirgaceae bacterium]|nr:dienelactone hydrolase family protein [Flammeovirgaceae bacterium]